MANILLCRPSLQVIKNRGLINEREQVALLSLRKSLFSASQREGGNHADEKNQVSGLKPPEARLAALGLPPLLLMH